MIRAVVLLVGLVATALPALAQDPVKVAPKNYSVVVENDQVRVLRAVLGPGETIRMHDHPANVVIPLTDAVGRFTLPDGETQEQKMAAGMPVWAAAEKHAVANLSKTKIEVIVVELNQAKIEATIFAYDGQDFVRIKTTMVTEEGQSAVNTKLDHDTPAYKALIQKRSYTGDVTAFGRKYDANYAPLTSADGRLTGALFVAVAK